ncbi:MAG: hypothetical protein K0B15_04160 [Lentimicrobium sp.]|nr:hypothetical protein [Lentimicrobium sp.]
MRKQLTRSSILAIRPKLLLILITFSVIVINCKKDKDDQHGDPLPPVNPTDIQKPANHNDPAILPTPTTIIEKYDGEFTPLLTDVIANWRITSAVRYQHWLYADCWSNVKAETFNGVTRSNVKGKNITYQKCGSHPSNKTLKPDFSKSDNIYWAQYKKGVEVYDSAGHIYTWHPEYPEGFHYINDDPLVRYRRYYTVPDLPDAYIMLHRRWENVQPKGGGDYAMCVGCAELEYESSVTSGLNIEKTEEWGYTLGYEYTVGAEVGAPGVFISASHKLSATVQQRFQTAISTYEEKTETLRYLGKALPGYNIIRCQVFREIATIKLVNQDGGDYYPGVFSPEIETAVNLQVYFWYYK